MEKDSRDQVLLRNHGFRRRKIDRENRERMSDQTQSILEGRDQESLHELRTSYFQLTN